MGSSYYPKAGIRVSEDPAPEFSSPIIGSLLCKVKLVH
jgi:hypothetical protein